MKINGWEIALQAALDQAAAESFIWGQNDCATWAYEVVRRLTDGPDLAAAWRGGYSTATGALMHLRRMGCADFAELGVQTMGKAIPHIGLAQRGDLVLLTANSGPFGVCVGSNVAFLAKTGLTFRRLLECQMAWRI